MAGSLRKLFTDAEILKAREDSNGVTEMSRKLTALGRGDISHRVAAYWLRQFDTKKKNGDYYLTSTVANREIRQGMELRSPSINDDISECSLGGSGERILFFTDMHAPYNHPDAIAFLAWLVKEYQPTLSVCGGDEVDNHALSFHDSDPNLDSAGPELVKSQAFMRELADVIPELTLVHSNHGSLVYRRAIKHGIPVQCIKSYRDILFPDGGGEGWSWFDQFRVSLPNGQDLQFEHEASGDLLGMAAHERCNIAIGHLHAKFAINYAASKAALYWAMNAGCLLDRSALAFAYGKNSKMKPIIGAGMIIDSIPVMIPMLLNSDGRWVGK